ncbi:MAG TPA: FxLYD domain-containing protein [Patescibacteria group bacterium]|nr:FxLYD domain-containing protein [Patescibacteria group bacterium]
MSKAKYLKGPCQHCGGHLEFLADHIGMVVPCPHCQRETELQLMTPPSEPSVPIRALVWTAIAVIILGLGFGAAIIALKKAQRWAEKQKQLVSRAAVLESPSNLPAATGETNGLDQTELSASAATLEKTPGSSLIYAVGTLTNATSRQRFGVKVELELLNSSGQKVGLASDYRSILEPGARWQFKALVVQPKAASAKVSSIREDQ